MDLRRHHRIRMIEFSVNQMIMTIDSVKLKYDFSDVVFLSSPVKAKDD